MTAITKCPNCAFPLQEINGLCPQCGQCYCPECGAFLSEDADKCLRCGAEFAAYCSECDKEVPDNAVICPFCGASLEESDSPEDTGFELKPIDLILPARFSGQCPACEAPVFLEDGFCSHCGAAFCSACGKLIGEEDDVCPHCQTTLYINCPLCGFELMTGTDQCPDCNALIPNYCTVCQVALPRDAQQCPNCAEKVRVLRRESARVIHSLKLGENIVQVAACPGCGGKLHLSEGVCGACGYRICPGCQISLLPDEAICPRCGPDKAQIVLTPHHLRECSNCGQPLQAMDDECPHCAQLFCPDCFSPIGENDAVCSKCGAEFDFECPLCGHAVGVEDPVCASCGAEI
jgi:predicted amidophosphoribosyltransferase